jgi:hypothetical protein
MKNKPDNQQENNFPERLSNPARRALAGAGIRRLEQLTTLTEDQVKKLHGKGPLGIAQLKNALASRGLSFAEAKRKD